MQINYKEYPFLQQRKSIWVEIVRYVTRYLNINSISAANLLELGAGYCNFINNFDADVKTCYEANSDMQKFAAGNVDFRNSDAVELAGIEENYYDLVFASNFLEHLDDNQLKLILKRISFCLKPYGSLILIQPNYRLCKARYFEDETHVTIFDDHSISIFLESNEFEIIKSIPDFLPLTVQSKIPKHPLLVRAYLNSPIRPFAGQMFIHARKG